MNRRDLVTLASAYALAPLRRTLDAETIHGMSRPTMTGDNSSPEHIRVAGIREIPVRGGKYKVWTKKVGSGKTKVLLLHGGPGASHEYLEAFESFLPQAGIEFYYYDQLGCNNSDQPTDSSLWTIDGYLKEVEEVRKGLGLDNFVLYGHSWGGVLAIEYALRYPQHLRALVISNMAAGMKAYVTRINWWRSQLPPDVQKKLDEFDRNGDYESAAYADVMMSAVYTQAICRLQPWPEPLTRSFRHLNQSIYVAMQGRSEFQMTGNLKDWERWDSLSKIKTRTLTIGSRYDEMDPNDMKRMAELMPNATYAYCPNGSHMSMWDDQAIYFDHLLKFLKSA